MHSKLSALLFTSALAIGVGRAPPVVADEGEHMKVIQETKDLKKHMKAFSKGLGVKCTTCHVKKDWESEEKAMKDKTRPFFRATVGVEDPEKRAAALKELLTLLELDEARDVDKVWKGIDGMKLKAD